MVSVCDSEDGRQEDKIHDEGCDDRQSDQDTKTCDCCIERCDVDQEPSTQNDRCTDHGSCSMMGGGRNRTFTIARLYEAGFEVVQKMDRVIDCDPECNGSNEQVIQVDWDVG